MVDRDKVINELVEHIESALSVDSDYVDCVRTDLLQYTVALLKEQEAKTGTWQWKIHGKAESGGTLGEAICDQCGKSTYATAVKGDLNYCPNCGAKMTDGR